jgi:hypothetical protein
MMGNSNDELKNVMVRARNLLDEHYTAVEKAYTASLEAIIRMKTTATTAAAKTGGAITRRRHRKARRTYKHRRSA